MHGENSIAPKRALACASTRADAVTPITLRAHSPGARDPDAEAAAVRCASSRSEDASVPHSVRGNLLYIGASFNRAMARSKTA